MGQHAILKALQRVEPEITGMGSVDLSDWIAEQTNFPCEVAEMALAHAVGDKVEAAYRRGDLFRKAPPTRRGVGKLLCWAAWISPSRFSS